MLSLKKLSYFTNRFNQSYYKHLYRNSAVNVQLKDITEIPSNFGVDEIKEYVASPYEFWQNKRNKYGDIFKLTMNRADIIITTDLKLMKEAYTMELQGKCERGYTHETVQLIGKSFVTKASQSTHRAMRKDWNPLFTANKVCDYSHIIKKEAVSLLDYMATQNKYMNVFEVVTNFSLDCSVQIWLGKTILNEMKYNESKLFQLFPLWNSGYNVIDMENEYQSNLWNNSLNSKEILQTELDFYINRANQLYLENKLETNTVLYKFLSKEALNKYWNTQLDKSDPFWGDELGELLAIMMTDAFNTPVYNNLFYILSQKEYSESVEKLRYELLKDDIVYNIDNISQLLQQVPYLDYFSREVVRIFCSLNLFLRQITSNIEFNGYLLPKGTMIASPISYFNYSDQYWDKPNLFNPMRFHPSNSNKNNTKAFMSFSTGNRRCLGKDLVLMEVSVFLATFIKYHYKIESYVTGQRLYPFNTVPINAIVYKP